MADSQGGAIYIKKENAWVLAVEGSASPPAAADGDHVLPGSGITITRDPPGSANATISLSQTRDFNFVTQTLLASEAQCESNSEANAPWIEIPQNLIPKSTKIVRLTVHFRCGGGPAILYSSTGYGSNTTTITPIISSRMCYGVSSRGDGDNTGAQTFFELPLMRYVPAGGVNDKNWIKFWIVNSTANQQTNFDAAAGGGVLLDGYWI